MPSKQPRPTKKDANPLDFAFEFMMGQQPDNSVMLEQMVGGGDQGDGDGGYLAQLDDPKTPVLRWGDKGAPVKALQQALANAGVSIVVDGDFGENTYKALLTFQEDHGLAADGVYGRDTARFLQKQATMRQEMNYTWAAGTEQDPTREAYNGSASNANANAATHGEIPSVPELLTAPIRDIVYEQLAHHFAYLGFGDKVPKDIEKYEIWKDRDFLESLGYTLIEAYDDPLTGFQCVLFAPTAGGVLVEDALTGAQRRSAANLKPVVAFRGSQGDKSWIDDCNPEGAGAMQFRLNEAKITSMLTKGATLGSTPDVIGHSLGGGLAQMTAAHYPGMVHQVVTFQAVGLSSTDADFGEDADPKNATHYRVKGDIVPLGGDQFLPGKSTDIAMSGTEDYAHAHVRYPLATMNQNLSKPQDPKNPWRKPKAGAEFLPGLAGSSVSNADDAHESGTHEGLLVKPAKALFGEFGREDLRLATAGHESDVAGVDSLNGPICLLAEELRADVRQWRQGGLTGGSLRAKIRSLVLGRQPGLCDDAIKLHATTGGHKASKKALDAFIVTPELRAACNALCERLIEQTIELDEQQQAGDVHRRGW